MRSVTDSREPCVFEIFGNFLLQDIKTGALTVTRGYRCVSDISLTSGFRDGCDFSVEVSRAAHLGDLATNLLNGTYTRHFERIFQDSSRAIVSLLQLVVCCDKLTFSRSWHRPGEEYKNKSSAK